MLYVEIDPVNGAIIQKTTLKEIATEHRKTASIPVAAPPEEIKIEKPESALRRKQIRDTLLKAEEPADDVEAEVDRLSPKDFRVYKKVDTKMPNVPENRIVTSGEPRLVDGKYKILYNVRVLTKDEKDALKTEEGRKKKRELLSPLVNSIEGLDDLVTFLHDVSVATQIALPKTLQDIIDNKT